MGDAIPSMSPRERLMAAFRREPCDRVPFAPIVDGYFQASLPGGNDRPAADIQFELADHVLSRVGVLAPNVPLWIGAFGVKDPPPGVEERLSADGGDIVHEVATPVGGLRWRLRFAPESPYIPWVIEHRIRTLEDVRTFRYLIDHASFRVSRSRLAEQQRLVGERGVVAVLGPCSPLQQLINFDAGVERVAYLLADHPDEMDELLDAFHALQLEMWRAMAELPAEVYFIHDNLSSTTTSRAMYRRYDRRYVNDYADLLHARGKRLITHWCGRLTGFAEDVAEARQDGISDVTPAPTGDMDLVAARRSWARHFVVIGGIDPTVFAEASPDGVDAYVDDLLTRMGPDRRGFILGSGDAVPFGTPPANVRAAARAAARFAVG